MRKVFLIGNLLLATALFGGLYLRGAIAEERPGAREEVEGISKSGVPLGEALVAVGAAIALGLGAVGTGLAQGRIGSAGIGAIAENPRMFIYALIFIAIPETLLIFGFVIAFLLMKYAGIM